MTRKDLILAAFVATLCGGCGKAGQSALQSAPAPKPALLAVLGGPDYSYGFEPVGVSADHSFTVANNGGLIATNVAGALYLTQAFSFKGGSYPGQGGDCGSTIGSGQSCTVVVTFTPPDALTYETSINFSYFDGTNTQLIMAPDLSGQGQ